ncbi:unnamed protein product [Durusdinium trenchii]|uniref:Calmodulin n=2 Tax=Durusdinium trenchii TaxID=1381693 RepID=A0ABP0M3V9_9DINO
MHATVKTTIGNTEDRRTASDMQCSRQLLREVGVHVNWIRREQLLVDCPMKTMKGFGNIVLLTESRDHLHRWVCRSLLATHSSQICTRFDFAFVLMRITELTLAAAQAVRLKSFARKKGGDAMAGLTEEMKQLAGFRRGVPLQNNHRGATLENSEYLASKENVQPVELENLKRVFKWLDTKKDDRICWQELSEALVKLGAKTPKDQIELWIWEVDDDLDQMVGWDEFLTMYQRCISDQTGFEPRNLFNLVQFLMYDKEFHGKISVEQTLQIIYVRHGRSNLDDEITEIFGQQQKGSDGQELKISFSQYLALGSDELRWAQEHLSNTSLVSNHRLFMGDTNDLSIALGRFGYSAKQLPPPANIYQHRDAMVNEVRKNLAEGELALQQQLSRQQEQLEELQTQQRTRFKLALDCQVKADEYALSKRHNEQLMQLQQQAQARRAQLEQQATSLVLEFQQRKLQEEFFLQQKEIHRQHQEEQQRLGSELQKLGCSGAQALTLLGPQFFKVSRQAKESPSSLTLSHIPSFTTPKAASLTTRPSFQVFQSHAIAGRVVGSMQLPAGMNRSSSWAGHDLRKQEASIKAV